MPKLPALCGEPTCKTAFEAELSASKPWPVICPACKRSLYPEDVLEASSLEFLAPHPGPLIVRDGARTRPILSSELKARAGGAPAPDGAALLDEVLDVTVQKSRRRRGRKIALALAGAAALAALAALAFLLRRAL